VGVQLVHDRQIENQAVLPRAVRGDHLQPAAGGTDLAARNLDARGDLRVLGHLAGDVEQNARLLTRRGADNDLLATAAQRLHNATAASKVDLPQPLGIKTNVSRRGENTSSTISRWKSSSRWPSIPKNATKRSVSLVATQQPLQLALRPLGARDIPQRPLKRHRSRNLAVTRQAGQNCDRLGVTRRPLDRGRALQQLAQEHRTGGPARPQLVQSG
jgi:hypothetical protein